MMNVQTMSLKEVERAGLAALSRELGTVGLIRFLQLFETGYGDYTAERHQWLDDQSLDEILARIEARRRTEE
jgi:hypothetical protein